MARRHSWLQTPKDRETERVRDRQKEREMEGVTETEGGEEMIKIEGKRGSP